MKEIRFSQHALEKLRLTQRQGIVIDEAAVVEAIRRAQQVWPGHSGRSIVQATLDEEYLLRVVYEESEVITVVTLYPGRRQRYEG